MEFNRELLKAAADVVSSQNVKAPAPVPVLGIPGILVSVIGDPTIDGMTVFRSLGISYVIGPKKKSI